MDRAAADQFRRADAVFDAALDVAPNERAEFVERACAGDAQLVAAVERLLRACDGSDGFLNTPAADLAGPLIGDEMPATGAPATTPPDRIGPYRIEREIGRGGMGVVYLAVRDDPSFRQCVALKVVRGGTPDGRAHVARFLAERQLLVSLEHPHIARLFDGGMTADGLPYYTMVFCEGGSLAERLRARGSLPIAEALRITRELATALAAAHARGVVHRDVKPANVLFDAGGAVRLSDFGVAKLLGDDVTRSDAVPGSVAYLAPEQLRGERIDHRADLWALGVTLYEMLGGRRPFVGPSHAAVMHAILDTEPEPLRQRLPGIPAAVEALAAGLLSKDPVARTASAEEVVRAVDDAAASINTAASVVPARNGLRRRQVRVGIALGALGLFATAVAGYITWRYSAALRENRPGAEGMRLVAVLPFENATSAAGDDAVVDGFTDELIGMLGAVRGLRVTPRSSAFVLRRSALSTRAKADTLGVDYLVEGSARHIGRAFVLFVQLVHPRDRVALWTGTYRGEWKDLFTVQPAIAQEVAEALRLQFALPDARRSGTYSSADSLYLLGRLALNVRAPPQSLRSAEEYFKKVIARDSTYAKAYSGLSDVYTSIAVLGYGPPAQASANARANADRALQLDPTLAEARTSLGHALCTHDFDWKGSERELRRALERNPSYSYARRVFAICLQSQARFDEAIAQLDTAVKADPLNRGLAAVLGRVYLNAGRTDDAILVLAQTTHVYPESDMAWEQLGQAYLLKGRNGDAIAALRTAAQLSGARDSGQLAYAYAVTGDRSAAERIVRTLLASRSHRYVPPYSIAMAYAGLGRTNDAFQWLNLAVSERASFSNSTMIDPAFRSLHHDPRWVLLVARLDLHWSGG